jgi:DNA-binding CsgD family transcriptional regulator
MSANYYNYNLFFKFIKTYQSVGFEGINRQDPLLIELEEMMEKNKQFFYIADLIKIKILFTSERSTQMIGIEPDKVTPERFFEVRHPDDKEKHVVLREKIFNTAHKLYNSEKSEMLLSSCARVRNCEEKYIPVLSQAYFFNTEMPHKTVYMLIVFTEVTCFSKMHCKYHHYFGNDMLLFRYPDEDLINTGHIFSEREFEILYLLNKGLSTKKIAETLFISPYTVNTHRSNILQKSGKDTIPELLSWLKENGRI